VKPPKKPDALATRPKCEVADIFKRYSLLLPRPLYKEAAKVVRDIIDCRTRKLGGHVRQCTDCGHEEIAYNSCRNRHCPKCQFLARAEWVEARIDELLPVEYFHVVFTLPHELNPLILQNKKELYGLLFHAASATIKEVAESKIGGEPGFIAVLHTWDQKLMDHPHLHMIVPGGGLRTNAEGKDEWVSCKRGFLLPLAALKKVFRGKFLSGLRELSSSLKYEGRLEKLRDPRRFKKLLDVTTRKEWVVYAKPPFSGPEVVIHYLGNYTHRVGISNHRITKIENGRVHFRYRDSADGNKRKEMSLDAQEFMRRFLLHVLPQRFVRIRHYGFLGNRFRKAKIERLKNVLIPKKENESETKSSSSDKHDWKERLKKLTGVDITVCPECKNGCMEEVQVIESFYDRRRRGVKRKGLDTS
jgi:hypothetical protein